MSSKRDLSGAAGARSHDSASNPPWAPALRPVNSRIVVLLAGALMAASGCSHHQEAPRVFGAKQTYDYLQKVGLVRVLINAGNKDRIPAMIRGEDITKLGAEGVKIGEYKHTLSALSPEGVDTDALKFTRNFEAILDSYATVCFDSAERFREIKESNARQTGPGAPLPPIRYALESAQTDTLGTVDAMLDSVGRMDTTAKPGGVFLPPIVDKVRDDREGLASAKVAHHDFSEKLKEELKERYPGLDWSAKEILP